MLVALREVRHEITDLVFGSASLSGSPFGCRGFSIGWSFSSLGDFLLAADKASLPVTKAASRGPLPLPCRVKQERGQRSLASTCSSHPGAQAWGPPSSGTPTVCSKQMVWARDASLSSHEDRRLVGRSDLPNLEIRDRGTTQKSSRLCRSFFLVTATPRARFWMARRGSWGVVRGCGNFPGTSAGLVPSFLSSDLHPAGG